MILKWLKHCLEKKKDKAIGLLSEAEPSDELLDCRSGVSVESSGCVNSRKFACINRFHKNI